MRFAPIVRTAAVSGAAIAAVLGGLYLWTRPAPLPAAAMPAPPSEAVLAAGARVVALGDCMVCHTARDGAAYIHYTRMSDQDIELAYQYLLSRTPVHAPAPRNELPFPLNVRPCWRSGTRSTCARATPAFPPPSRTRSSAAATWSTRSATAPPTIAA